MNIYDNQDFFDKYSQMGRSKDGLAAAGEWEQLRALLPDFNNATVLDLGCGYGWHAKYISEQGASKVVAIDGSSKMIERALEINADSRIDYHLSSIEGLSYQPESFDQIISSLVMHYIEDYKTVIENVYSWLKPGGTLTFSCEHPVFTSTENQDFEYDEHGQIKHFAVDNYSYERQLTTNFLGAEVIKYHRTLETYLNTLLAAGFKLNKIVEPTPPKSMLDIPGMKDEYRRPMMLIISVTK